jgi:hypothetical protein
MGGIIKHLDEFSALFANEIACRELSEHTGHSSTQRRAIRGRAD